MQKIIFLIFGLSFLHISVLFSQDNRSIDGSGNNILNPDLGATHTQLKRFTSIGYSDGISAPGGLTRPNPRTISNELFAQDTLVNDPLNLSDFVWVFGQFMDHDISLTGDSNESAFVQVPAGDPWFDPFGQGTALIFMSRSEPMSGTGTSTSNPREHPNEITTWIDASNVYGSDTARANWLRTFVDGKMKVSLGNLLPFNTFTGNYATPINYNAPGMDDAVGISNYHFVAGDVRANENPLLSAFHTLFVREHNRLCDILKLEYPNWTDEQLYQHTRKIVGGLIQNIVYSEWLPAMGLQVDPYAGYDSTIDPRIMNVFSTAAFRMGHTLLNSTLLRLDNDGNEIPDGHLALQDAFFNPLSMIWTGGGIDVLFKGMGTQVEQDLDCKVIDDVRNFLFGPPGAGGLDLASININRGRERGLPDFNTIRSDFGLTPYNTFIDLNPDTSVANTLQQLYGDINNLDAWVGMLAEGHMPNALFGETIMEIMEVQFMGLRDGDRFYFENDSALSATEISEIQNTTLHDIIMRNTNISLMQPNVFEALPHNEICNPNDNIAIEGTINTSTGNQVGNVDITLDNGTTTSTIFQGLYSLSAAKCLEHTMTLSRTDNPANGVTAFDIALIQQHILGLSTISDPFLQIAGDVNRSNEITTFDIIHIRQVILGLVPDFPDSPSWLFFEDGFTFNDPTDPFTTPLPDNVYTFSVEDPNVVMNFTAIKIGDVTGNAQLNNDDIDTRNDFESTLQLIAEDKEIKAGEHIDIYLNPSDDIDLMSFQFTMNFDNNVLEFINLESSAKEFTAANYAIFEDEGAVTICHSGDSFFSKTNSILHFSFNALQDGKLSDLIHISSRITKVEAYSTKENMLDIELNFNGINGSSSLNSDLRLYQNQPNPFNASTEISFYLPSASEVELKIFDLSGRVITSLQNEFEAGTQTVQINKSELDQTGVFYYQLQTKFGNLTKKMVLIQ